MAFPSSPTNGQQATVNNILYTYNSTYGTWTRQATQISNVTIAGASSISPSTGALVVTGGAGVVGRLNVGGLAVMQNDTYIIGNLYVAGNTTTVDAVSIRTNDQDLVLANNAASSAQAAGSGILVGPNGAYGNISMYSGTWITPNNFDVRGSLSVNGALVSTQNLSADYGLVSQATTFQVDYGTVV
jgi:hypothetical protein